MIRIKKTVYNWGTLRVLEKGNSYNAIIHPEDWDEIKKLILGKEKEVFFKDEQGICWRAICEDEKLTFTAKGNKKIKVDLKELE